MSTKFKLRSNDTLIRVRRSGDTYIARIGTGQAARIASSTNSAFYAAQAVAAKYFGVPVNPRPLDGSFVHSENWASCMRKAKKGGQS